MCILCVEYHKGKLTLSEAWNNYLEMIETMEADHSLEVQDMLQEAAIDSDELFGNFLILKENTYQKICVHFLNPDEEDDCEEDLFLPFHH